MLVNMSVYLIRVYILLFYLLYTALVLSGLSVYPSEDCETARYDIR
jgi:hypothetical protein